jgi:hypothetical protein
LKISADQLSGCASSYASASVVVNNIVLPVRFINVNAIRVSNYVKLSWEVTDEMNVRNYLVERSYDGQNFESIGTVDYTASATINKYFYTDNAAQGSKIYYRIKQVDVNGNYVYSSIVLAPATTEVTLQVWPNPATNKVAINIVADKVQQTVLELIDINGKKLLIRNIQLLPGSNSFSLNNLSGYGRGTYFLKICTDSENYYRKLIIK